MINRRELGRIAGMTLAAVSLGACTSPHASTPSAGGHTSLASVKQIDAGLLNIGYAEDGPPEGKPVILLHGWPYDIHSYVDVAPALAAKGYRVIVPFLRGHGTTTFRSADTSRNGQQSAVALDIIALMDALNIPKAVIGGFDWGSRTAGIIAALWPERCKALVAVSGYLITNLAANLKPLPPEAQHGWCTSTTSPPSAALATGRTPTTSTSSSGKPPHRNGTSMTPPMTAPRQRSPTPITSPSWSTTTGGG